MQRKICWLTDQRQTSTVGQSVSKTAFFPPLPTPRESVYVFTLVQVLSLLCELISNESDSREERFLLAHDYRWSRAWSLGPMLLGRTSWWQECVEETIHLMEGKGLRARKGSGTRYILQRQSMLTFLQLQSSLKGP